MNPDWRDQAACRDEDPEAWFPGPGESQTTIKKICNACPVKLDCLEYAFTNREPDGVWGGLSTKERDRLLRKAAA